MYVKEVRTTLQCSYNSCRKWRNEGKLRTTKMPNGKVMYWDDDVYALMGKKIQKENWTVVYTRVGGTTESDRGTMLRQQELIRSWSAVRGLAIDRLYEDWAPATSFSLEQRPGLHELLQDVIKKKVSVVIVETPCRLARVGWELFPALFKYYGVEVVVINGAIQVPEYRAEQEKDLVNLLLKAGVDRLDTLGVDPLPVPRKREKVQHPGKIVPDWEDKPTVKEDQELSDLM